MSNLNQIGQQIAGAFGINTIKSKIVDGIKYSQEKLGVKLVAEEWGSSKANNPDKFDCACALGCMLLANNCNLSENDTEHNEREVSKLLGVSDEWITGFIAGFDAGSNDGDDDAYALGREIRNEFKLNEPEEEECDDGEDHY